MKKTLLAIAITAALFPLAFSTEANAERKPKDAKALIEETLILGPGPGPGGGGGIWLNGSKLQGTSMQATKGQGMELQNLKVIGGQLVAVTQVAGETPLSKLPVSAYED